MGANGVVVAELGRVRRVSVAAARRCKSGRALGRAFARRGYVGRVRAAVGRGRRVGRRVVVEPRLVVAAQRAYRRRL